MLGNYLAYMEDLFSWLRLRFQFLILIVHAIIHRLSYTADGDAVVYAIFVYHQG